MATWHTNLAHMGDAPGARLLSKAIGRVLFTGERGRGILRSSLGRRGLGVAFEDMPRGYEILGIGKRREGSGAERSDSPNRR